MDDRSDGPSYLLNVWMESCEWMGRSHLAVAYSYIAISRFYLALGIGERAFRVDDPAPTLPTSDTH